MDLFFETMDRVTPDDSSFHVRLSGTRANRLKPEMILRSTIYLHVLAILMCIGMILQELTYRHSGAAIPLAGSPSLFIIVPALRIGGTLNSKSSGHNRVILVVRRFISDCSMFGTVFLGGSLRVFPGNGIVLACVAPAGDFGLSASFGRIINV